MNSLPAEADSQTIDQVFEAQQQTALQWRNSTRQERIARIARLRDGVLKHREALYQAFQADFHKPQMEVDGTEIIPVLDEARHTISHLKGWMRPTRVRATQLTLGTSAAIHYQPRGRCLIIAPWNYPLYLLFGPLISALAAGNTVILKPSELAPRVSAVMALIIQEAFATHEVALFEGALQTSQALLNKPFDHIFFTGSPAVGKIVMTAAAKHLASVTLELGGKSPAIVDETADLKSAAENLMWGKFVNSGQTCVAPDYLYVHASVKDAFLKSCVQALQLRYGTTAEAQKSNPDFTHIINERHAQRISGLLDDAKQRGARVLAGGAVDTEGHYIAPTLLDSVAPDSTILQEEIFGPLLPVLPYSDLQEVIARINAGPKPLALYVWSHDQKHIDSLIANTSSGGMCVNHCMVHVAHANLPFGGVNNSGMGNAHGLFGFKAFSHQRAVLHGGWLPTIKLFYPPYTQFRQRVVSFLLAQLSR